MVILAFGVVSNLEDDGTEPAAAPSNSSKLFRVVILLIDQINLIEDFMRLFEVDAVVPFDASTFSRSKSKRIGI